MPEVGGIPSNAMGYREKSFRIPLDTVGMSVGSRWDTVGYFGIQWDVLGLGIQIMFAEWDMYGLL